ncbi:hypothetical protein GGS23DRAFT_596312 [Durotheca rogersii]|uniref:uncharacterized protein n=1 Tax=Durotheca rogersii TaxID=419775 RepID=UPI0022204801|nr:uncharacterized protein GGS23DRAFT_596312 [Durotheca rogersii]KAI5863815.1 hypothetical protein GGS23DRAFT_596312 [Durotheca rogersii]
MSLGLPTQIRSSLQAQAFPIPSSAWIESALPNRNPLPPLPALVATIKTRLLAVDLTTPGLLEAPAPAFPANLVNPEVTEIKLAEDIPVQVLDVENLSRSKWEQVEELEAIARGEQTKGREIVRLPIRNAADGDDDEDGAGEDTAAGRSSGSAAASAAAAARANANATHRLVLQDCQGQKVHGVELKRIERVGVGVLNIGEKMMLRRGATVARGVVLLEPATCAVLGGKVEAWQRAWLDSRLARLKEAVGADAA